MNYYRMGPPAVFAIAAAAGLALFLTLKDAHNGQQEWEIGDASSAIAQAARIVGIPEHVAVSAELVVVEDDVTPFLHDQILGKRLWKVIAQDWNLDLPSASASGAEGSVVRTFEILVNPVNGSILKIRSRWPEGIAQIAPEPPADVAAEQMTRSGWESYDGFPKDEPSVSFLQALDVVPRSFGDPLVATQITGVYVNRTSMGYGPMPVWAITLRGITKIRVGSGGIRSGPVDTRSVYQIRHIVSAETGRWMTSTNTPRPVTGSTAMPLLVPAFYGPSVTLELTSSITGVVTPGSPIDWSIRATASPLDNLGLALVVTDLVQDDQNPAFLEIPAGIRPANMVDFDRPNGISNPALVGSGSAYGGTQFGTPGAMDLLQIGGGQNVLGIAGNGIGLDIDVEAGVGQEPGGRVIATGSFAAPCTDGLYVFSIESGVANLLAEVNQGGPSEAMSAEIIYGDGSFDFDSFSFTVDTASGQVPPDNRWHVNASADGDSDGSDWSNAFRNLQDAIAFAEASPGSDEIWVGAGTYYPDRDALSPNGSGNTAASFDLHENVAIYGGFLGIDETLLTDRNPEDNTTILTGALTTGYYFPDCGDPGAGPCDSANGTPGCEDATCCQTVCAVMPDCCDDQFGWVQACVDLAEADRCENCGVPDAGPCDEENGTPGCEDAVCCSLVCEQLPFCCVNPWSEQCKDQADQCYAPTSQAGTIVTATGVSISAVLNGFTISDGGGGLQGAGILIESASPLIVRCTLTANDAVCSDPKNPQGDEGQGGAIHIGGNSSPTLINCSFIANTACEGAALHTEASGTDIAEATLINCLFAGNTSSAHGGAIDAGGFDAANLRIINCTFVNNTADDGGGPEQGGGAIYNHRGGTVTITNSILWNNYPDEIKIPVGDPSPVVVSFSDVEGGVLGEGNIDIDPSFCDPDAGVFRLRPDSACLDAGSDAAVPLDYSDLDDNGQFCEPLPWDLDALPRFFDALASTSDVDMGAYESHVAGTCPWDCGNSDGDVGIFDFLELLDQWGDPGLCDFDGDGVVGIIDFLLLLASWGACPDTECVASLTIQQELALHCLDQADWDLHEAVMTDPTSSQLKKDRYHCWMRHYLYDCDYCSCSTALCPGKDPFR